MDVVRIFLIFFFTGLFQVTSLIGQEPEELVTDRPDQTESSRTVPHKAFQIEGGFLLGSTIIDESTLWEYSFPSILLRYGLFRGFELRLGDQFKSTRYINNDSLNTINGIDDLTFGVKFNLMKGQGLIPEMAMIISGSIPIGSPDYTQKMVVPSIIMAASHSIAQSVGLGYNLGWIGPVNVHGGSLIYSLVVGTSFKKLGAFAEIYGSWIHFHSMELKFDGGITLLIRENIQWDASGGLGLNTRTWFLSTGMSIRLPG